jgi:exopolysaccharide biosynthesis polyprenyl glycosylphosphotransferase
VSRSGRTPSATAVPGAHPTEEPGTLRAVPPPRPPTRRPAWWVALRSSPVLGNGVAPFFMTLDVLAWSIGSALTGAQTAHSVLLLGVLLALLAQGGSYRSRLTLSVLEDWTKLVGRTLAATAVVVSGVLLLPGQGGERELLLTGAVVAAAVVALRAVGYALVRWARSRGAGQPPHARARCRPHRRTAGRDAAGAPGVRPAARGLPGLRSLLTPDVLTVPVLGGDEALASTIAAYDIEDVIVAFGSLKEDQLVEVLRTCDRLECEIFFVPRLFELHAVSREMDHVWGLPLVRQHRAAFRSASWRIKRLLDVLLSGAALLALAPLLVVLAFAVRLEGGPGILFRQTRVGLDERPFELLKFRSLRPVDGDESATRWNIAHDDRLGPVGRMLRQSSLDELPQLWNILRGDMSLVGPRPERPHFVNTFTSTLPRYPARHRVPAGLTGWAQVHGLRGDTSIADRARFDNYYIENWSLGLDLRILLMTLVSVLTRRGG